MLWAEDFSYHLLWIGQAYPGAQKCGLGLLEIAVTENNKALLERIAQMLTKLIKARRPNIRS